MQKQVLKISGIFLVFIFTFLNSIYALTPQNELRYEGIDISNWQGYIDYKEGTQYTVQRGDSLWRIARTYRTTVRSIVVLNGITNPNLIYPGQILRIY